MWLKGISLALILQSASLVAAQGIRGPWDQPPIQENFGSWSLDCQFDRMVDRYDCHLETVFTINGEKTYLRILPRLGVVVTQLRLEAAALRAEKNAAAYAVRCVFGSCMFAPADSRRLIAEFAASKQVLVRAGYGANAPEMYVALDGFAAALQRLQKEAGPVTPPATLPPPDDPGLPSLLKRV